MLVEVSTGEQYQATVIGDEEAMVGTFCTYSLRPYLNQGKVSPFSWVWGIGILYTTMLTSTIHIYSGIDKALMMDTL